MVCILIRTSAISPYYLFEVYDLFQLWLCIIFCFLFVFPAEWGNLPLQSYWSLFCDHGLLGIDEFMLEQQHMIWTSFVSSGLFLVGTMLSTRSGFCCDPFSIWYVFWYVRDLTILFVWGIRFVSVMVVYYLLFFICFSSWGNIPLQSYWSLPCDHGLHCTDELTLEQQQCSSAIL